MIPFSIFLPQGTPALLQAVFRDSGVTSIGKDEITLNCLIMLSKVVFPWRLTGMLHSASSLVYGAGSLINPVLRPMQLQRKPLISPGRIPVHAQKQLGIGIIS